MAKNNTRLRFAIMASTLLVSFLRAVILMFGLFYVTPLYPLLAIISSIGLVAAFGSRLGIEFDPMMILLGGLINIIDGEITIKDNMWSFVIWGLNFVLSFVGHILGGVAFIALNSGVTLPAALIPQQVLPGGWWIHLIATVIFTLPVCILFVLLSVYSTDGYAATPVRFWTHVSVASIFFFIARDVADYGLTWAAYLAANNLGTTSDGLTLFFGWLISIGITIGLYYLFWQPVASKVAKTTAKCGRPVCINHILGMGDLDQCTKDAMERAKEIVRMEMEMEKEGTTSTGRKSGKRGMALL